MRALREGPVGRFLALSDSARVADLLPWLLPLGRSPSVTAQLWAAQKSECSGVSDLRSCILLLKALTGSKSPQ